MLLHLFGQFLEGGFSEVDAGLVREERRGKWSFYSLDREAASELLGEAKDRLLCGSEKRSVGGGCC